MSLNLNHLAISVRERQTEMMKERIDKDPDRLPVRILTKDILYIKEMLEEKSNFYKYPLEKLLTYSDYPMKGIEWNFSRMFGELDETNMKYKITILSSCKAALLWYSLNNFVVQNYYIGI